MTRTLNVYKSYNFKDRDPILDIVFTAIDDENVSYAYIEAHSGVTTHTLRQWRNGKTKRPQFCTVQAVLRSIGRELVSQTMKPHTNVYRIRSTRDR